MKRRENIQLSQRIFSRGECDDQIKIVGLYLSLVRGAATRDAAAFFTAMHKHVAALGIGLGADGAQGTAAFVCSVAGIYVHVQGIKTKGTVIARGVAEG